MIVKFPCFRRNEINVVDGWCKGLYQGWETLNIGGTHCWTKGNAPENRVQVKADKGWMARRKTGKKCYENQ